MKVADRPRDECTQHQRYAAQHHGMDGSRNDQEEQRKGKRERRADRAQREMHRAVLEKLPASDEADEIAVELHDQDEARHPGRPMPYLEATVSNAPVERPAPVRFAVPNGRSFADVLLAMPNVGTDDDFARKD